MDRPTPKTSERMRRVRQHGTDCEQRVRRSLLQMGASYRLNVIGLPGRPDIAHQGRKKAIFVHGCFWHSHRGCSRATLPKNNRAFWIEKLKKNRERDTKKVEDLRARGFSVLTIWECETEDAGFLQQRLRQFWFN